MVRVGDPSELLRPASAKNSTTWACRLPWLPLSARTWSASLSTMAWAIFFWARRGERWLLQPERASPLFAGIGAADVARRRGDPLARAPGGRVPLPSRRVGLRVAQCPAGRPAASSDSKQVRDVEQDRAGAESARNQGKFDGPPGPVVGSEQTAAGMQAAQRRWSRRSGPRGPRRTCSSSPVRSCEARALSTGLTQLWMMERVMLRLAPTEPEVTALIGCPNMSPSTEADVYENCPCVT